MMLAKWLPQAFLMSVHKVTNKIFHVMQIML